MTLLAIVPSASICAVLPQAATIGASVEAQYPQLDCTFFDRQQGYLYLRLPHLRCPVGIRADCAVCADCAARVNTRVESKTVSRTRGHSLKTATPENTYVAEGSIIGGSVHVYCIGVLSFGHGSTPTFSNECISLRWGTGSWNRVDDN